MLHTPGTEGPDRPPFDLYGEYEEDDPPQARGDDGVHEVQLHEGQLAVIEGPERFKTLVAGRRWGKSETDAAWTWTQVGHNLSSRNRGVGWVVAPTVKHLRTLWKKLMATAPRGWVTGSKGTVHAPDSITCGGVVLEFRSAHRPENLVGEGLLFLLADECGLIKEQTWNESLRPTLADYSAPALLSGTPKGRNWFHRMAMRGMDPLDKEHGFYGGPSYENPFILESEIDLLAADMTRMAYQQEILARFISGEGSVFGDVRSRVSPYSRLPTVALGIDIARRRDYTVIIGMDANCGITYYDRFNDINWPVQRAKIKAVYENLGQPHIVIDSTGVGDAFVQELQLEIFNVTPFLFTPKSKNSLVEQLVIGLEREKGGIRLVDEPVLLNELEVFEMRPLPSGHTRYTAPEGAHDDVVMALALAALGAEKHGDLGITI